MTPPLTAPIAIVGAVVTAPLAPNADPLHDARGSHMHRLEARTHHARACRATYEHGATFHRLHAMGCYAR